MQILTKLTHQNNNIYGENWFSSIHSQQYSPQKKVKFSIKDFFSNFDQIRSLQTWSHFLKKGLMENFIFCAVICRSCFFKLIFPLLDHPSSVILWQDVTFLTFIPKKVKAILTSAIFVRFCANKALNLEKYHYVASK